MRARRCRPVMGRGRRFESIDPCDFRRNGNLNSPGGRHTQFAGKRALGASRTDDSAINLFTYRSRAPFIRPSFRLRRVSVQRSDRRKRRSIADPMYYIRCWFRAELDKRTSSWTGLFGGSPSPGQILKKHGEEISLFRRNMLLWLAQERTDSFRVELTRTAADDAIRVDSLACPTD